MRFVDDAPFERLKLMHRALRMRGKQHWFIQGGFNPLAGHIEEHDVPLFIEYPAVSENFTVAEVMQDFEASRMQAWRPVAEPEDFPVKIEKGMRFRNLFFHIYFPEAVCHRQPGLC